MWFVWFRQPLLIGFHCHKFSIERYALPFAVRTAVRGGNCSVGGEMRYRTWNDEDTEQLIRLWRNYSESQVAEKMQRTRNAVAGKLNRLRAAGIELKHPETNLVHSKPRVYAPRPKRVKPPPTPKPPPPPRVA